MYAVEAFFFPPPSREPEHPCGVRGLPQVERNDDLGVGRDPRAERSLPEVRNFLQRETGVLLLADDAEVPRDAEE
eukprot:31334-Pelagococcus_subviridis.AAC.3